MAEQRSSVKNGEADEEEAKSNKQLKNVDPELFCCLLQPANADADAEYIGIRRLLLYREAEAGFFRLGDNLLVDASVADGFHLKVHTPISLRWIAGVLEGICKLPIQSLVTEQVSPLVQVIMIVLIIRMLSLPILLLECVASSINAKPLLLC